jgi:hypothetical protein
MLAPEDRAPTLARVMKITPAESSKPSAAQSKPVAPVPAPPAAKTPKYEDDYVSSDEGTSGGGGTVSGNGTTEVEEDDGWDVVPVKKKSTSCRVQS